MDNTVLEKTQKPLAQEDKALLTAGATMWGTAAVGGLPVLNMADGPMGVASGRVDERDVAVLTPAPVALGASWDADLVYRMGQVIAADAARTGVDALLAPNLNLPRSPLAGRAFEYFSEDPFLTGSLGFAWTQGLQAEGVGAIPKHMACNDSETDRNTVDIQVDEATLREVYMLPFEMQLTARPAGFLMAYNRVNGSYCAEHALMMQRIVKGEWRYDGMLISDWFGVQNGLASAQNGLDLEMPGPGRHMGQHVLSMLEDGTLTQERLNDAAERVASAARRFAGKGRQAPLDREALAEAAAAGMVLLKNEGDVLPLDPERHRRIALIGPNWTAPCYQGGTFAKIAVDPALPTPYQAVTSALKGRFDLVFAQGCLSEPILPPMPVRPIQDLGDGRSEGMTVCYFDSHDFTRQPVAQETRATNSLTWFARTAVAAIIDRAAGVRASGLFIPKHTGRHLLYVGGTGSIRVLVNGVLLHEDHAVYAPADIMGRLKSGEADCIEVMVDNLKPIKIEIELRYPPAHVQGLWYGLAEPDRSEDMLREAEKVAASADLVLLMVGETSDASVESKDRQGLDLSTRQLELIRRVSAANPATVAIVNVGHALSLGFDDQVRALMLALYPGQEFGTALAHVLTGTREPGGRLAFSIARSADDYPAFGLQPDAQGRLSYDEGRLIGYRGLQVRQRKPHFGLGHGMGYARIALTATKFAEGRLSATMTNSADRPGKAVVQLYAQLSGEDFLSLVGYACGMVPAKGQSQMTVVPDMRPLRRWQNDQWITPSNVTFYAGETLESALQRGEIGTLP
ncbi:beta-glucosidase [Allorhizobium terrae]|uniref:Beta-glucosidase n=1 Tax=Allorhizobium terrae TaxID=1848972 RepID=A0A4S3ZY00_9HYPH|nr:glycoside hydrolase family 3 C-terminal domain-containing protein [Allorhizobium terrae]THF50800.1 beta-glucosidase [Allorhizobium terrae]